MADISKITALNGTTYDIKDAKAYRLGATVRNRNTSINQDPVYASLIPNKKTLECQTLIRAVGGAGDVFYSAYKNPNLTVECSYEGVNGVHASTLFSPGANSTILVPVTDLSSNPFVITVTKASNIGATDVMHLALFEHTLGNTAARLTDYKVELLTTGSTASSGDYSWQTVYQRSNVSDAINGLTIALNPTKYAYLYFKGVRFTVTGATPITTNSSGWGYNCFDLSLFQLISTRPDYTSARAIGALDIDGGEVYGNVTFYGGITGNGASLTNLNANNIASGTVPVARLPVATSSANGVTKLYTGANSNAENTALTPASLYNMANRSICPYYSASETYTVGDKVRYGDYIYECITAITTAEAWTAAHWQIAPTLQEQITGLAVKSDLIFSNVNEIKSYLLTTYGNRNGEYFDFLSVAHTDTSETIMTPNNRWVGYVCKDTGGSSLIFVAHNRYGNDIKLTYSFSDQSWKLNSLSSRLEAGNSFNFTLNSSQTSQFEINKMRAKIFGNIYILCLVLKPLTDIDTGEIQLGEVSVSPGLNTATVVTRNSDTKPVGGANLLENRKLYMNLTESVNRGNNIYISFVTTYS